jgi:hypothetical protein
MTPMALQDFISLKAAEFISSSNLDRAPSPRIYSFCSENNQIWRRVIASFVQVCLVYDNNRYIDNLMNYFNLPIKFQYQ